MRKALKISALLFISASIIGAAVGFTYANYNAPGEDTIYRFDSSSMDNSDKIFQDYSYYFGGGNGSQQNPYLINNSQQLRNFSKLQNLGVLQDSNYYALGSSFEYDNSAPLEPIGTSDNPFVGHFNGLDCSITGLRVSTSSALNVGLFGVVGSDDIIGTVERIVLIGPEVQYTGTSSVNIGFVAGSVNATEVDEETSYVKDIDIYGGTSVFSSYRAYLRSGGNPTCANGIVGVGTSTTAGFVSSVVTNHLVNSVITYTGTALAPNTINTKNTNYYVYHNGSNVVVSNSK